MRHRISKWLVSLGFDWKLFKRGGDIGITYAIRGSFIFAITETILGAIDSNFWGTTGGI